MMTETKALPFVKLFHILSFVSASNILVTHACFTYPLEGENAVNDYFYQTLLVRDTQIIQTWGPS